MEQFLEELTDITDELYGTFKWAHEEKPTLILEDGVLRISGIFTIYTIAMVYNEPIFELVISDSLGGKLLGSEFEKENLHYVINSVWHSIYIEEAGFITKVKDVIHNQTDMASTDTEGISA